MHAVMVNIASTVMVGKNLNFTLKSTNDIHVPYKNAKMCIAQNFINLKNEENLDHTLSIYLGAVQQFSLQAYTYLNCKIKRSSWETVGK